MCQGVQDVARRMQNHCSIISTEMACFRYWLLIDLFSHVNLPILYNVSSQTMCGFVSSTHAINMAVPARDVIKAAAPRHGKTPLRSPLHSILLKFIRYKMEELLIRSPTVLDPTLGPRGRVQVGVILLTKATCLGESLRRLRKVRSGRADINSNHRTALRDYAA